MEASKEKRSNLSRAGIRTVLLAAAAAAAFAAFPCAPASAQELVLTDNVFLNMVKYYAKSGDMERALLELKKLQDLYPNNSEYKKYEEALRSEYARGFRHDEKPRQEAPRGADASPKKTFRRESTPSAAAAADRELPPGVAEKNAEIARGRLRYVYELLGRNEDVQAIGKLREIISAEPRFLEALTLIGDIYLGRKNYDEALPFFKRAVEIRQDAATNYKIATCYKAAGDTDNAIVHYDIALRMNPAHENASLAMGNILRFRGNFKAARPYYEQALRANQKLVEAHLGMADCLFNEGGLEEATKAYAYIITSFPGEYPAYLGLGRILITNKQYNEAKAVILKAKELAPNSAQVFEMLGIYCFETKDTKAAIENFRRAIMIDPVSRTAYESLINILVSEKKYEEALTQIKNSLARFPKNPRLYYLAGVIYSGFKNDNLAQKNLLMAYQLEPGNIETVLALAILYENGFKYREALDKYREALIMTEERKDTRFMHNIQDKIESLEKKIERFNEDKK